MRILSIVVVAVSLFVTSEASASWASVKRYLQADVQVVLETEDKLVVRHPKIARTIVIANKKAKDVDIVTELHHRRGGNPYRVWLAMPRFVTDKATPRDKWGLIFKTPFLRIMRFPRLS